VPAPAPDAGESGPLRLSDADGLIAIAEPDPSGQWLKPVVGFRG
jgi:hypothetical protein